MIHVVLQVNSDQEETIRMTTSDVNNYKAVDDIIKNGSSAHNAAHVELRKRKESFAKRQQSFQRQNSCGVEIDRPLTRFKYLKKD